jgi:HemY protein
LQVGQARPRRAVRTLLTAWRRAPQPDLAKAYGDLFADETPVKRVKRLEHLAAANPNHPESHLAVAEAALAAKLWGEARRHLGAAGASEADPSARVCRMMAQVEEGEHDDRAAAQAWLARAARSPVADAAYVCSNCGTESQDWSTLCPNCHEFGSLEWRVPTRARLAPPDRAGALAPLIDIERPRITGAA